MINYMINRFIRKTHLLPSKLERGVWHDTDTKLLHCSFEGLVDYVEQECAWVYCYTDERRKLYGHPNWRSAEAGLAYLQWESELCEDGELTDQAKFAQNFITLYNWWKNRDKRPDPWSLTDPVYAKIEAAGYNLFSLPESEVELNKELREASKRAWDTEFQYRTEDKEMLLMLVENMEGMWT